MHADLNPVSFACPQLQNYDPERALTDYINRLEALQKRLGSVHSGRAQAPSPGQHRAHCQGGAGSLRYITNNFDFINFQP